MREASREGRQTTNDRRQQQKTKTLLLRAPLVAIGVQKLLGAKIEGPLFFLPLICKKYTLAKYLNTDVELVCKGNPNLWV